MSVVASTPPRWGRKTSIWAGAVSITAVVGTSRLYLGAYWLTDVPSGWALGSLWLLLVLAASRLTANAPASASVPPSSPTSSPPRSR